MQFAQGLEQNEESADSRGHRQDRIRNHFVQTVLQPECRGFSPNFHHKSQQPHQRHEWLQQSESNPEGQGCCQQVLDNARTEGQEPV